MQRANPEILEVRERLEASDAETHQKFTMYKARVYRITKDKWRLYIPDELRYDSFRSSQITLSYRNRQNIGSRKGSILQYFLRIREFVAKYIERCINCIYYKTPSGKLMGLLHPYDKGSRSFEVHIDHLGSFICTENENKYIIAAIDGFSKYCVLKAIRSAGTQEAIEFVKELVTTYGRPIKIVTDRGVAFTSNFESLCKNLNVQHVKVASGIPRANGQVEQINKADK